MAEKNKSDKKRTPDGSSKSERSDAPTPIGEIDHGPSKLEVFLENNQKLLLVASVLAVLGVSAWIIIKELKETKGTKAGEALVAAKDMGDYRNVMVEFARTPAAGTAALLLAQAQWTDGLKSDAMTTLRDFIKANPEHAAQPSARMALASYLLEDGETEEGTNLLKEISEDEKARHLAAFALIRLGDLASAGGDLKTAREYYEKAEGLEKQYVRIAEELVRPRLDILGVDTPVTVPKPDPPKPPPPRIRPPLLPADAPDNTAPEPVKPANATEPTDPEPGPATDPAPSADPAPKTDPESATDPEPETNSEPKIDPSAGPEIDPDSGQDPKPEEDPEPAPENP